MPINQKGSWVEVKDRMKNYRLRLRNLVPRFKVVPINIAAMAMLSNNILRFPIRSQDSDVYRY